MKILVFENSQQIVDRVVSLIAENMKDISFYKANSYGEALYFLKECNPDVVLLDLKDPYKNGVESLKKIEEDEKTMFIALLNEVDETKVSHCDDFKADFVFEKNADLDIIPAIFNAMR